MAGPVKTKRAPGRKNAPTQSIRQTRARSRLTNAPPLMNGLDDRGKPKDELAKEPEKLTYSEVLDNINKQKKQVTFRRSESPEPEDHNDRSGRRRRSAPAPPLSESSSSASEYDAPEGGNGKDGSGSGSGKSAASEHNASEDSNGEDTNGEDKSNSGKSAASARGTPSRHESTVLRSSSSSDSDQDADDPISPTLTRRRSLASASSVPNSQERSFQGRRPKSRTLPPIRTLNLPRPEVPTSRLLPDDSAWDSIESSSDQPPLVANGTPDEPSNYRSDPLKFSPFVDTSPTRAPYSGSSTDSRGSVTGGLSPGRIPSRATRRKRRPTANIEPQLPEIKQENSVSPPPESGGGGTSTSSADSSAPGSSGDQQRTRKRSEDDEGSSPQAKKRRASENNSNSPTPESESSSSSSSPAPGCSGDQQRTRKRSEDDDGSSPQAKKRRASKEDGFFYDVDPSSSATPKSGSTKNNQAKKTQSTKSNPPSQPVDGQKPKAKRYHIMGVDCIKVHRCRKGVCHQCHAKWHSSWAWYFQVEEEIALTLENPDHSLHDTCEEVYEDGDGILPDRSGVEIVNGMPCPPKGGSVRAHPVRIAKKRLLQMKALKE
ncbi:hypothetical protein BGZ61DRAFT_472864 [Ilyonectria robusta]|uniref:uncharacterized protein n=1 Tax=Ilyonectria robusta TaxID=1079257 RepID=UPI001E8EBBEB|nr:uncharacterized protein BGZ61DRAFT_472864 [Ilyonectria robusta]KAH8736546.1 hypothetical protein BGZ61DRAFT_472864 [Ilyonectria robusta]